MNSESSSTSELRIQQMHVRRDSQSDEQNFCCISTANTLHRLEQYLTEGFLHIANRCQILKENLIERGWLKRTGMEHLGQSNAAIGRHLRERVNNDRY